MHSAVLLAVLLFAAFTTIFAAKELTDEMLSCGGQLLLTISEEPNAGLKTKMRSIYKLMQDGDNKASQQIIKSFDAATFADVKKRYWIDDCAFVAKCVECPIEL